MLFDWIVGQVLDALDRTGAADNTLILVTSDNGGRLTCADGEVAGTVTDLWVDRTEPHVRYLEVKVKQGRKKAKKRPTPPKNPTVSEVSEKGPSPTWYVVTMFGLMAVGILTSELVAALDWAINGDRVFVGPMGKPDRAAVVAFGATMLERLIDVAWLLADHLADPPIAAQLDVVGRHALTQGAELEVRLHGRKRPVEVVARP